MMTRGRREIQEEEEEQWVTDSSLDHKGKPPLRSSTGAWKASLFIIVMEFSERMSYFGIAANLIIYLTKVMHEDLKTAAKSANYWGGVTTMMPLVGGFLADAYLGRFGMVLISSSIYVVGLCLLTMSQLIPALKPCSMATCNRVQRTHEIVFLLGIYLISVGTGGHKPALESFGADQFDDSHSEERKKKMSFFNWWNSALCAGLMLGVTVIVYLQDEVSWASSYIVLTVVMATTMIVFYIGKPFYRYRATQGSPLTPLLQVLVAAIAKRGLPHPSDPTKLHQVSDHLDRNQRRGLLRHTSKLKFLDKAAIVEEVGDEEKGSSSNMPSPWRLATVSQVEELKLVLNTVPIWLSTFVFGMCIAQITTFFVKQGATMNRKIGQHDFKIPPASLFSLGAIGMIITICIYDRVLEPKLRRVTGKERGITILQRIGIGMALVTLSMFVAAGVERKRLRIAKREILNRGGETVIPMSVFWLAPQFMIHGIGDGFALVGLQEFFYGQVPDNMKSLGIGLYLSVLGIADFLSSFLIIAVDYITSREGGSSSSWFGKDLNHSRLDKFYCLLAIMSGVNLCVYVLLATRYSYKDVKREVGCVHSGRNHTGEENDQAVGEMR